ncbi:MAG: hypothetical protein ABIT37_00695 [Luteolibacter sp.]
MPQRQDEKHRCYRDKIEPTEIARKVTLFSLGVPRVQAVKKS